MDLTGPRMTCDIVQFRMLFGYFVGKVFGDNPLIDHDGDAEAEVPKFMSIHFAMDLFFCVKPVR